MESTSICGRDEFRHVDGIQRRDLPQAALEDCKTVRPATSEEEAWLSSEDQVMMDEEEWAVLHSDDGGDTEVPASSEEAEAFELHKEHALWIQAQEQACAREEAESVCRLEEQNDQELLELVNVGDINRYLRWKNLQQGADFLLHEESTEKASIEVLVSIQQSAKQLLEVVDRALHGKMEQERVNACNRYNEALLHQRKIEDFAEKERVQRKSEIFKLKQQNRDLNEMLEREKDRTTCRICFTKPRDALPLPCLHFDYCHACLDRSQTMRNLCPTCRSPISGVLKCNLAIG